MIAAQQSAEDLSGVSSSPVVFFAQRMGISFRDDDPVAQNSAVLEAIKVAQKDDVVTQDGITSFSVDSAEVGYFLHIAYCNAKEGNMVVAEFDGIYSFEAPSEDGRMQKYNAQLITLSEQPY